MLKALAFGVATGAAIQAWRNFPPDGPATQQTVASVVILGVLCAYLAGRWHGRGRSSASATATATATAVASSVAQAHQTVNVAVVMPGGGARPMGVTSPGGAMPWLDDAPRREVTADDLDGLDMAEFLDTESEVGR